jgi:P22 coat protein - gene protein 5
MTADRKIFLDPLTQARTVSSLAGLFNPQRQVSEQYRTGEMSRDSLGFDWFMDQTVIKHTNGSFTAGTVNGGSQSGSTIAVNAITGNLFVGDIITFAGCFAVNRITKLTTGELQQFVVTAAVASGGTAIPIYPAMIPSNAGAPVAYQTVVAAPATGAAITLLGGAGLIYRKNFALADQAVTMATADLELPKNVQMAERISDSDVSMRLAQQWDVINDDFITRLDILYGYAAIRPEWIVCVPDIL